MNQLAGESLLLDELHAAIEAAAVLRVVGGDRRIRAIPIRLKLRNGDTVFGG
jgi:hypothetical protein